MNDGVTPSVIMTAIDSISRFAREDRGMEWNQPGRISYHWESTKDSINLQ